MASKPPRRVLVAIDKFGVAIGVVPLCLSRQTVKECGGRTVVYVTEVRRKAKRKAAKRAR